jgi:hypothetical protein
MSAYKLDPAHYYTAPGLSWDALLKHSGTTLEIIRDPDMHLMVERGIRGGVSTISHRHAKANNPYIPETYDTEKPTSYITYLDANNLYGWAMSQYLPTGGFKWRKTNTREWPRSTKPLDACDAYYCSVCNLNVPDLELHEAGNYHKTELEEYEQPPPPPQLDVMTIADDSPKGYILEVDLEYPENLHDLHNDYPLAPECVEIDGVTKLIPTLRGKSKYVVHYRSLKQYLRLGLRLVKVHRVLEFDQSPWMKSYIDLNTEMRKRASNDFDRNFYKLMNNSVFGKTMENIRKRIDVRMVKTREQCQRLLNKPNCHSFKIFTQNLAAVHMKKTRLFFCKPLYVGQAVLDISKTLMYDFHYNVIKRQYNAQLLFTDTDSLCYHIHTNDIYQDMKGLMIDTSNYPPDHPAHSEVNKKVLGLMKDETAGLPIEEFIGLRAKLYSFRTGGHEEKKAKGVVKRVIQKKIQFDDYKRVLFERCTIYRSMEVFSAKMHQVYTERVNKVALSGDDDKRIVQHDRIHTLAYGHYKVEHNRLSEVEVMV